MSVSGHTEESSLSVGYWDTEPTNPGQSPGQCEPMYKQRWGQNHGMSPLYN